MSNDYQRMKDEDDSPIKFKFTQGDLIVQNKEKDTFLGIFTPDEIDTECFCGCDLNKGIYVVCCFIFYIISFHIFKILYSNNMLTYIIGTFKCACYIITFFNIIQMLEELSYDKAVFNYRFFMFIFYMEIILIIFETVYLIIYNPLYFSSYTFLGLIFSYGSIVVTLLIEIYMIWIIFCYMEHIKNNRLYLLQDIKDNNLFAISP